VGELGAKSNRSGNLIVDFRGVTRRGLKEWVGIRRVLRREYTTCIPIEERVRRRCKVKSGSVVGLATSLKESRGASGYTCCRGAWKLV